VAAKLAAEKEPEEIPQLAHELHIYGAQMMQKHAEDSVGHCMACRLTEMDAKTTQNNVRLPFGCQKNRYLNDSMIQKNVSEECAHYICQLESTYVLENQLELCQEVFVGMMWIYIAVLSLLLTMLASKYCARRGFRLLRVENPPGDLLQPRTQASS
jgi:hypothetical protein